jgi:hypothetical protein
MIAIAHVRLGGCRRLQWVQEFLVGAAFIAKYEIADLTFIFSQTLHRA